MNTQSLKKLLLFPFNGNAREAASVVEAVNEQQPTWQLLGFLDDDTATHGHRLGDHVVLGGRELLHNHRDAFVLAVPGRPDNFRQRAALIDSLGLDPERLATIIHPSVAQGINCTVGRNTLLMANVVLTANVTIGNHVIVLPNTVISHETSIDDYCLVGSNVSLSGGVVVESQCYLGSGARIIQEVRIGSGAMVGLGAVVLRHVLPGAVVAGNPAKTLLVAP